MKFLKRQFSQFFASIRFFTRIPLPGGGAMSDVDFGKSLAYAPLTGLIIGILLAGSDYLFRLALPDNVVAVLTLLVYVAISGGLHLDGLGDTFDGILSGRSKERMLEIMKDSRVGSFGVLAVFFVLSLNIVSLAALPEENRFAVLCFWPVLGRLASVTGASLFPYARPEGGLGKSFVAYCGKKELALGLVITLILGFLLLGFIGIEWALLGFITSLLLLWRFTKPLGGITGDVMGAGCEATQALALPVWLIIGHLI